MVEPINLNKARKARAKTAGRLTAAENRAKFGQPKAERAKHKTLEAKAAKALDDTKRER